MTRGTGVRHGQHNRLGARITELLRGSRLPRKLVALRANVSVSYISKIEHGWSAPSEETLERLAVAFELDDVGKNELFIMAGRTPPRGETDPVLELVASAIGDPTIRPEEASALRSVISDALGSWRNRREACAKRVQKAVIPAAGWQARLLSARQAQETLQHAIDEAKRAGITSVFLVLDPVMADAVVHGLRKPDLSFHKVVQDLPRGIAHAVLLTREGIGNEPFALILPDDVDPRRRALSDMVKCFATLRKPLIAVDREASARAPLEARHFGLAVLGAAGTRNSHVFPVRELHEKPLTGRLAGSRARILGRYVLTPDVFQAIADTPRNRATGQLELTDALSRWLSMSGELFGYELPHPLLPLVPVKLLIEQVVQSIGDAKRFETLLTVVTKAVDRIGSGRSRKKSRGRPGNVPPAARNRPE